MPTDMKVKARLDPLLGPPESTRTADPVASELIDAPSASTSVRQAQWRLATDALLLLLAGAFEALSAPAADLSQEPGWRITFLVLVLAALGLRGAYRAHVGQHFLDAARMILSATALAAMIVTFLRVAVTDNSLVAEEEIRSWLFAAVYLIGGRAVLSMVMERRNRLGHGVPTIILGAGRVGHLVARRLLAHPELGLRPIGFVDADPLEVESPSGLQMLGSQHDLEEVVREHGIEHAIVSFSNAPHADQLAISRALHRMRISVSIIPRLFEGVPDKISLERVGGLPLVTIYPSNPRNWRMSVKYALDRVFAFCAIVLVSPFLLFAAVGTALTMGSPILFSQRRVGLDDREFDMLKFRTMRTGGTEDDEKGSSIADRAVEEGLGPGGAEGEHRVTRFGSLLRRTNVDELPQLFNVLRGEMSVVGPRPERPAFVEQFKDRVSRYQDRHQVRAGITGWAQVHGLRGNTSIDDRVEWDNYYIENWSPWLDIKIILLTFLTVFK
jgi:exopolysaccharide biosynthesis polyprenyl glycosylphosphotransferase